MVATIDTTTTYTTENDLTKKRKKTKTNSIYLSKADYLVITWHVGYITVYVCILTQVSKLVRGLSEIINKFITYLAI